MKPLTWAHSVPARAGSVEDTVGRRSLPRAVGRAPSRRSSWGTAVHTRRLSSRLRPESGFTCTSRDTHRTGRRPRVPLWTPIPCPDPQRPLCTGTHVTRRACATTPHSSRTRDTHRTRGAHSGPRSPQEATLCAAASQTLTTGCFAMWRWVSLPDGGLCHRETPQAQQAGLARLRKETPKTSQKANQSG